MTVPMTAAEKLFAGFLFVAGCLAPHGAEKNVAADAGQQAQTVNDVPDRGNNGQCSRTRRPLILPHHGSVYHAVDGRDQGAAKGGGEVFEVDRSDLIRQEIHKMASMVIDIRFPCVL